MEITATIIAMRHILGFKVLAEGVETQEQLDFLRHKGAIAIRAMSPASRYRRQILPKAPSLQAKLSTHLYSQLIALKFIKDGF